MSSVKKQVESKVEKENESVKEENVVLKRSLTLDKRALEILFKIFRIPLKQNYDEKMFDLVSCVSVLGNGSFIFGGFLVLLLLTFVLNDFGRDGNGYLSASFYVLMCCFVFSFSASYILFFIGWVRKKPKQWMFLVYSVQNMFLLLPLLFVFSGRFGQSFDVVFINFMIMFAYSVNFSCKKRLWGSVFIANIVMLVPQIAYFVYNIVIFSLYGQPQISDSEVVINYVFNFFIKLIVGGTVCYMFFNVKLTLDTERKIIGEMLQYIRVLDFSGRSVRDLVQKDDRDCSNFQKIIKDILVKLIFYKRYLPLTLHEKDNKDYYEKHVSSDQSSHSASYKGGSRTFESPSESGSSRSSRGSVSNDKYIDFSNSQIIVRKNVVLMFVCLEWIQKEGFIRDVNDKKLEKFYGGIEKLAETKGGVFELLKDGNVLLSWNLYRISVNPQKNCYSVAIELCKQKKVVGCSIMVKSLLANGNIGSKNRKTHCILGSSMEKLYALSVKNKRMQFSKILLSANESNLLDRECCYYFQIYKFEEKGVYCIFDKIETNENKEWLYTIKDHLCNSYEKIINHFWDLYESGKIEECGKILEGKIKLVNENYILYLSSLLKKKQKRFTENISNV